LIITIFSDYVDSVSKKQFATNVKLFVAIKKSTSFFIKKLLFV